MKKFLLSVVFCLMVSSLYAQYYYQDIYSTMQTNTQHQLFEQLKVKSLTVVSSSSGGDSGNDTFTAKKLLSADYSTMTTITGSASAGQSALISRFDSSGRIQQVTDSSGSSKNEISYQYDSNGYLSIINSKATSVAKGDTFTITETHHYYYNSNGKPVKMQRLKNNSKFSTVSFEIDSAGKVTSELEQGKGVNAQRIYYRYNKAGMLTDVIRYNSKLRRMLPDYMIDYDDNGRVSQLTTVTPETLDYILCKYAYDAKGLKSSETCYGKHEQLLGNMQYQYSYYQNVNK